MCSNIKLSKQKSVIRGRKAPFIPYLGLGAREGTFGLNNGLLYNCRSEKISLNNTQWYNQSYHRGLVEMIGFYEGGGDFIHTNNESIFAACLYNDNNEFILLTENSTGVVAKFHGRMPVLIDPNIVSQAAWFKEGRIIHLNPQLIRRA